MRWWEEGNNAETQKQRCQSDEPGRKACLHKNLENKIVSTKLGEKRWQQLIYMTLLEDKKQTVCNLRKASREVAQQLHIMQIEFATSWRYRIN